MFSLLLLLLLQASSERAILEVEDERAEDISVSDQNRQEFVELLDKVLSFDVDAYPEHRLPNILAQRRARWLRERIDLLFLEGEVP